MTTSDSPWTCPTCRSMLTTPFCPACGERRLLPVDLTVRGLSARLLHAVTSIDGRLLRTAGRLLRHPGQATLAYLAGDRKPYIAPFQIFLVANVLFFAIQSLTHTNIFGATLDSHLHRQDWSALAQSLVDARLQRTHSTLEAYAPVFDRAVVLNAKSLIILMVMPFALLPALPFLGRRQPFITHVVFSLHLYTVLLLLFSLDLMLTGTSVWLGGPGLDTAWVDNLVSSVNLALCGTYLYLALGPVYQSRGVARVGAAVLMAVAAAAIVLAYRFALFVLTFYFT